MRESPKPSSSSATLPQSPLSKGNLKTNQKDADSCIHQSPLNQGKLKNNQKDTDSCINQSALSRQNGNDAGPSRGEKRSAEADPEYEDVSSLQNKRLRVLEDDAKRQVVEKIEAIVRKQFAEEMCRKEGEVMALDERIRITRENLNKLRACLVASYYSKANQQQSVVSLNRDTKAAPSIHPTVKRLIGKAPARPRSAPLPGFTPSMRPSAPPSSSPSASSSTSPSVVRKSVFASTPPDVAHQGKRYDVPDSENLSAGKADLANKITSTTPIGRSDTSRSSRYTAEKTIVIGNVSKFIPLDKREQNDPSTHKWMLYVRGPRDQPDLSGYVEKVWFFLHPSYQPNDLVEVNRYPFHLTRRGWGEFPVRVQIHFKDKRNKKVDAIHKLTLDKTYTGLTTLGAETTIGVPILNPQPDPFAKECRSSESENSTSKTSASKTDENKTKVKVKTEPKVNGLLDSVVSDVDGHITIKHVESPPRKKIKIKTEPIIKTELDLLTNGLPKSKPISLLKDLPSTSSHKDDIFIQCVNSQGSTCFIPQTLFLESQKEAAKSKTKIPSPVRKKLKPPGSVSLLNRTFTPPLTPCASPSGSSTSLESAPSTSVAVSVSSTTATSASNSTTLSNIMLNALNSIPSPTRIVTMSSSFVSSPVINIAPSVSAASPVRNIVVPLHLSPLGSAKNLIPLTSTSRTITVPLISPAALPVTNANVLANSSNVVRNNNVITSPIRFNLQNVNSTSTAGVGPQVILSRSLPLTVTSQPIMTSPTSVVKPTFKATSLLATSQDNYTVERSTSILVPIPTPNHRPRMVGTAPRILAPAKGLCTKTNGIRVTSLPVGLPALAPPVHNSAVHSKIILQSLPKADSTAAGSAIRTISLGHTLGATQLPTLPLSALLPSTSVGPKPVAPAQLVRANVGGKMVWLQLLPSLDANHATLLPTLVNQSQNVTSQRVGQSQAHTHLTTPPPAIVQLFTPPPSIATPPLTPEDKSIFHKILPPTSFKKVALGRPKNVENVPKVIRVEQFSDLTSLLRVIVKEFPLVAKTFDRHIHPYCASSVGVLSTWNVGKQRAAEVGL